MAASPQNPADSDVRPSASDDPRPSTSDDPHLSTSDDPRLSTSEWHLLQRAREGSPSAIAVLFTRYSSWLRRWTHGRLPRWVRGVIDTSDLVQDSLHQTFSRLPWFEPEHAGALRAYLRRAVDNRIRDELRRAV